MTTVTATPFDMKQCHLYDNHLALIREDGIEKKVHVCMAIPSRGNMVFVEDPRGFDLRQVSVGSLKNLLKHK